MRTFNTLFFILSLLISTTLISKENTRTQSLPCNFFPANNIWNTAIDNLPVDANSTNYINTIGINSALKADFGSGEWNGAPIGIPYVIVDGDQTKVYVDFDYSDESDIGPYPIPEDPPIEGGNESDGDRHILMLDQDNCILYELYHAYQGEGGSWTAGSGAIFDLNSNALRPDTWTSADAAGLPILPGLVRYDEIADGEINHAIRFTVPKTQRAYIWPATHYASSITDKNYPPMGLRLRLKADFDISAYPPTLQIILHALKKYGMILADNGSAIFMSGVPDARWDDDELSQLRQIKGSSFEAVDVSSLMIDSRSGEAKQEPSSVNEDVSSLVSIYPNPATDYFEIKTDKIIDEIEIFDILGRKHPVTSCHPSIEGNYRLDIFELQPGVYFVRVGSEMLKFVKI